MMSHSRNKIMLTLSAMWMTLLALSTVAADVPAQIPDPDGQSPDADKPLKVASDKLTHPEKTIRHARKNLPRCIDTEDKKLTDLAHSLYEKCLFDKLWEPKLPGLPYRWFSISGANDSSYGKCQLLWDTMFILNAWTPLDDDELIWQGGLASKEHSLNYFQHGKIPVKASLEQSFYFYCMFCFPISSNGWKSP